MPVNDGGAAAGEMDTPSNKEKKEIQGEIIDKITDVSSLMRQKNSIIRSANFHLDAKPIGSQYKVDIQRSSGSKKTVAVIMLDEAATLALDARTGLSNSLTDHHVWNVT